MHVGLKNKVVFSEHIVRQAAGTSRQGFRLAHGTTKSEDMQREKENENVKVISFKNCRML